VQVSLDAPLAPLTTLALGGPARRLVHAADESELLSAVRTTHVDGRQLLVLAGGSNLVIADAGFDGTVVQVATSGWRVDGGSGEFLRLTAAAGEPWDDLVAGTVNEGLRGLECLSGIPGSTGATPIQNVGAYGQEVADAIAAVRVYDRQRDEILTLQPASCGFGYRSSRFKHRDRDRFVVVSVTFVLERARISAPIRYAELARALGVAPGDTAPPADVREAVLDLRRSKGMVIDPADPDSVSAGSFFTNPILDPATFAGLGERARERGDDQPPGWPEEDGRVKTSAAWLIERSGFGKGYGDGRIGLSQKHTLAIVNRGGGTTAELVAFARELRDGVRAAFGVELEAEPVLVGVSL
jgi:UDP-N-acetylmuramate dehydrogenase